MTHTLHALAPMQAGPSGTEPLRVMIAEGQGLVRAGFRALLEGQDGVRVVAEAATSEEAVAAARDARPDVALIDLDLPGAGGFETAQWILDDAAPGATRVVMLMTAADDAAVFGALRAGATGLLLKDAEPGELVAAVRAVADGDAVLAPALARRVVDDVVGRPERLRCTPEQLEELTAREREVMALVACGLSNDEMAARLVVTRATVKTHVSRALCKLHARDRAQLVVLAYEVGLVRPGAQRPKATERGVVDAIAQAHAVRHGGLRPLAA